MTKSALVCIISGLRDCCGLSSTANLSPSPSIFARTSDVVLVLWTTRYNKKKWNLQSVELSWCWICSCWVTDKDSEPVAGAFQWACQLTCSDPLKPTLNVNASYKSQMEYGWIREIAIHSLTYSSHPPQPPDHPLIHPLNPSYIAQHLQVWYMVWHGTVCHITCCPIHVGTCICLSVCRLVCLNIL